MRLVFMGTPDFARIALDTLVDAGHEIIAVYSQPPRPANRGRLTPSPVHMRAEMLGLPVHTPPHFKDAMARDVFAALQPDAAIVAAYGLLLPQSILDIPRHGCINIHASLLPRWRGAAPIQRAILAGDRETGVTIMQMERGLDTGPMLKSAAVPIASHTTGELTEILGHLGAELLLDVLAQLPGITPVPQPDAGVTYAHKIDKAEARIDWRANAADIVRLVRAMQPAPGAWFAIESQRVKLIAAETCDGDVNDDGAPGTLLADGRIACGMGAVRPLVVQPAGKPAMPAPDWWRGRRLDAGARCD